MTRDDSLQGVRGLSIASVVAIHCLPQCQAAVAVRPLLNWSVAAFLFLSGYLTSEVRIARGGVIVGRLRKTLIPYFVWSLAGLVIAKRLSIWSIAKALLLGTSSAQMYYLLVYAQLLLLTPLLYRLLRRHRALVYAVTPVFLGCREIVALLGVALPQIQVLFPAWLLYYVLGLDWERVEVSAKKASSKLPILWILIMALQVAIGYFWLAFGDYNMATTQLKLSSMLTSCVVLLLVGLRSEWAKSILSCRFLVRLGDCSFGIYLCHMVVMGAIGKLLGLLVLPMVMKTILMTILTLGVSYLVVSLAMRILPHGVCRVLGFV